MAGSVTHSSSWSAILFLFSENCDESTVSGTLSLVTKFRSLEAEHYNRDLTELVVGSDNVNQGISVISVFGFVLFFKVRGYWHSYLIVPILVVIFYF